MTTEEPKAELLHTFDSGAEFWREPDPEAEAGWRYFAIVDGKRYENAARMAEARNGKIRLIFDFD